MKKRRWIVIGGVVGFFLLLWACFMITGPVTQGGRMVVNSDTVTATATKTPGRVFADPTLRPLPTLKPMPTLGNFSKPLTKQKALTDTLTLPTQAPLPTLKPMATLKPMSDGGDDIRIPTLVPMPTLRP